MSTRTATLVGLCALVLWSLLAALTVATGKVPPFQLLAMTFAIGGCVGLATWIARPGASRALRQPFLVWLIGIAGLFGYHALYFIALRLAPPAEAGLLNYLWPLLIVLLSAPILGLRLSAYHLAGAVLGFIGTILLFAGNMDLRLDEGATRGLIAAFCAAFVWSSYSVLSRRFAQVPTDIVTGFCLATALLAALVHVAVEPTVVPQLWTQWLAIVILGVGPVGIAFFAWDIGMKKGDIRLLGAASYVTPLLSTFFLIVAGYAKPTATLGLSALFIGAGGLIAAKETLLPKRSQ